MRPCGASAREERGPGVQEVKLDGEEEWHRYAAGTYFEIAGNSGFDVKSVGGPAAYLCEYLPAA